MRTYSSGWFLFMVAVSVILGAMAWQIASMVGLVDAALHFLDAGRIDARGVDMMKGKKPFWVVMVLCASGSLFMLRQALIYRRQR